MIMVRGYSGAWPWWYKSHDQALHNAQADFVRVTAPADASSHTALPE